MLTNSLGRSDRLNRVHPVSQWAGKSEAGPLIFDRAEGLWMTDIHGKTYLDAFAGLWCVNVGYGQKSVVAAAQAQMEKLPYATGYFDFASEAAIRMAEKVAELTPGDLNHVYFSLGGSDAVDSALRFIDYYWTARGQPERKHILSLEKGYHGSSSTGAGVTGLAPFHAGFSVPTAHQHHIPAPGAYRSEDPSDAAVIAASVQALKDRVHALGADRVAAFFAEPVQGSGGVIVQPHGWLKAMREACDELGILFVVDEVITGFGRTGKMFAQEHEGVQADIMTMAKGMTSGYAPMGACVLSDKVFEGIAATGGTVGHGYTYSGHPVSAAVGLEVIRLYQEGGILANAQARAPAFMAALKRLEAHPLVGEVRGLGLLAAVEIVADKRRKTPFAADSGISQKLFSALLENGLIARCFNDGTIGLAPALTISPDQIDLIAERIETSLNTLSL
ncbi:aminotransferase class III-fold pyridoxal phosphate-dependent enzyme [Pseudooceanicola sp. CBS1P-1]|uniref:Aminotransferase class III-fold pyridoxal phosphate-dependent enzyme n=1 Tax=Pseudooceanicola albus TaxID=2692189 RepID=A0A6L7G781_9RHOB|nr:MULTISPECIES: aminotransferase class III-fold pyridoxal phosphate-dependent enzyme [Pseudooceanicola]MBT9386136.1 aminotransferase class III-fold pyridoxal phosphate-dependent enzyme [Pseudooceanicola endophyticus]MXN19447.1 aminotransferase class III-fold pyridoxal phosphate-dependent enzyme [Pseudooceanicola albus]